MDRSKVSEIVERYTTPPHTLEELANELGVTRQAVQLWRSQQININRRRMEFIVTVKPPESRGYQFAQEILTATNGT